MTVQAVVFDRDGVLVSTDRARLVRDLTRHVPWDERELGRMWARFVGGRALGAPADEDEVVRAFLRSLADACGAEGGARDAITAFEYAGYVVPYADALPAIERLAAAGVRVGLLTNNSAGLSPTRMLEGLGMARHFHAALSSQMIGAAKPDARAYLAIADALGASPCECVFVDNTPAWAEGARRVGMRAYTVDRSRDADALDAWVLKDLAGLDAALRHSSGSGASRQADQAR